MKASPRLALFKRHLVVLGIGVCFSIDAHHSRANFTQDAIVAIRGTVQEFRWGNPHLYITVVDTDAKRWLVEGHSIPGVLRLGWRKSSIKPGTQIAMGVYPDRERDGFALLEWVRTHDGSLLKAFAASQLPLELTSQSAPIERGVGHLQPSDDFSGNWRVDFTGVDLRTAGFKPADWPLTKIGRAQADSFDLGNDPVLDCIPRALPQVLKSAYGYRFERFSDRLVMHKEHDHTSWTIWLDGRARPSFAIGRFGFSKGSIDGAILEFETANFVADRWGLTRGIDSSAAKKVYTKYE